MTEKKLTQILNELRAIKPNEDYARKSRVLVLASAKPENVKFFAVKNVVEVLRLVTVTAFGIVLLLTIFGGVSYINQTFSPVLLPGLDQKSLVTEADEVNNSINVTLKEIKYLDNSAQATNKQIDQIANNKNGNKNISASPNINQTSTVPADSRYNRQINDLLEKASQ